MSAIFGRLKKKLKDDLIFKHGYIREQYGRYYAAHPGPGFQDRIKRAAKLAVLNITYRTEEPWRDDTGKLPAPSDFVRSLSGYDVISFDVFDTLIFRKTEKPVDVFFYMEAVYHFPRFGTLRIKAEEEARRQSASGEVGLDEIYSVLSRWIAVDREEWIQRELAAEEKLCYANPYMKAVYQEALAKGKRVIAVSDMYLSAEHIGRLLEKAGYRLPEKIFVSCEEQASKGEGKLFDIVKQYTGSARLVHIGDNMFSDYAQARKKGFASWYYPNVNQRYGECILPYGMSRLTGAFTKGIINPFLRNGLKRYSPYFEYGMINGGLLACGYCEYLNDVAQKLKIDKLLFLARDGFIIKKVYDAYYGQRESEYILFSRFCAEQILFEKYPEDYLRHNLYYRLNMKHKVSLGQLLHEIDLGFLTDLLPQYGLKREDIYSQENNDRIRRMIYDSKPLIIKHFNHTQENMYEYLEPLLKDCRRVMTVDLGWFGTGGLAVKFLLEEKYKKDIQVFSALVGTNEDESLEGRISAGELFPYAYSPVHNLYLLHWHTRNQYNVHNLLIELLFSAPYPSFLTFEKDETGELTARFSYKEEENHEMIQEMHSGIMAFAEQYHSLDPDIRKLLSINGGDAYAGFMYTAEQTEKCYELFKDYKISQLSGIFGSRSITSMGKIMEDDHYIRRQDKL